MRINPCNRFFLTLFLVLNTTTLNSSCLKLLVNNPIPLVRSTLAPTPQTPQDAQRKSTATQIPLEIPLEFPPVPADNRDVGLNSNVYLTAKLEITKTHINSFLTQNSKIAQSIALSQKLPPSAIMAMAIVESGWGTTRTAHYAKNFYGLKAWGIKPANSIQLVGQPDEDGGYVVQNLVVTNLDKVATAKNSNRLIFEESKRKDNWYYKFENFEQSTRFLVEQWLIGDLHKRGYPVVVKSYSENIRKGMSWNEAAKQFLFDLAEKGYCQKGGDWYRTNLGKVIDQWQLDKLDPNPAMTITF